jgi:acetyl esterase/lipase
MKVFRPENPNGAAVVICPGGALYAHSIDSEGESVAKALNKTGVTAFVLRYRLVPTGEASREKLIGVAPEEMFRQVAKVLPLSISDGLNAIEHVRMHADQYKVDKERIGIMGFSAGGAVAMGAAYRSESKNKPDFIAPLYFWEDAQKIEDVPADAGPAFILCATDDPLGLAPASAKLYLSWIEAGKAAELHMYSQGGHGFGMRDTDLPVGDWVPRFTEWMKVEGLME